MSASLRTRLGRLTGMALAAGKPGGGKGIATSTIRTFAVRVGGMGLNFLLGIALARWLGKSGFGVYSYANSWVGILTPVLMVGLDRLMVREMAAYRGTEKWELMRGVALRALQLSSAVSLVGAALAGVLFTATANPAEAAKTAVLWVAMVGLPFRAIASVLEAGIRGLDRVWLSQVPDNLVTPGVMTVAILACWAFVPSDPRLATTINVAINIVVCALMFAILWRELPKAAKAAKAEYRTNEWLRISAPFWFIAVLQAVSGKITPILIGNLRGTDLVGVYTGASRYSELIQFPLVVINLTLAPAVARQYARDELSQLQSTVTKATRVAFVASLLTSGAMMFGAYWVLMILGRDFTSGQTALRILCLSQLFNSLMGSVGVLMSMTKHEKAMASTLLLSTALTIALDFVLIPPYGVEGAAVASLIGMVVWNSVMVAIVMRHLKVNPTIFGGWRKPRSGEASDSS